ncbi:hypothetical protein SXCC_01485 [Gluconacetobacter sp. SXCC-1]|nr:hypothetical protein SXCC_01485 [Gluconacetobacter sp. SXCC-1]
MVPIMAMGAWSANSCAEPRPAGCQTRPVHRPFRLHGGMPARGLRATRYCKPAPDDYFCCDFVIQCIRYI